ncbi:MAG: hypothetical protein ABI553_10655 [Chloroflexota bacterium]
MNLFARTAAAAIVVVVVIGGAIYALSPGRGVGGPPTATPAPTLTAVPTQTAVPTPANPSPSPAILGSGGDVFPGTYVTRFEPPLTLTIDREVQHNCAPGFRCRGAIDTNLPGWVAFEFGQPPLEFNIVRLDKVVDLKHPGAVIDPPKDLAAWIATLPGISVVNPVKDVKVGGLDALQLDVQIGDKGVTLGPTWGFGANKAARIIVVTVDGHQIPIIMFGPDPFYASMQELQPLIDSIVWH